MKHFSLLYKKALAVSPGRQLTKDASCGGVGCAFRTRKGNVYTGLCIDCSCGLGFCAEHAAIAEMLKSGESKIAEIIAVTENNKILPPCGRCRELILQVDRTNTGTIIHLSKSRTKTIAQLLPEHWPV